MSPSRRFCAPGIEHLPQRSFFDPDFWLLLRSHRIQEHQKFVLLRTEAAHGYPGCDSQLHVLAKCDHGFSPPDRIVSVGLLLKWLPLDLFSLAKVQFGPFPARPAALCRFREGRSCPAI